MALVEAKLFQEFVMSGLTFSFSWKKASLEKHKEVDLFPRRGIFGMLRNVALRVDIIKLRLVDYRPSLTNGTAG